jgi:CRP/FNR family transcriptional regulator, cyclic AMP receptor protein
MGIEDLMKTVQSLNTDDAFHARLDPMQWRTLGAYLTAYQMRAGDLLIKQGDADRTAYFIGVGTLQVYRSGVPAGTSRIALLRPGALTGETGLFSDQPHSANVEAMTPTMVWAMHLPRFEEMAARAPAIAIEFLRASGAVMVARLRATMQHQVAAA